MVETVQWRVCELRDVCLWHGPEPEPALGGPERAGKDSSYHSVETCHISAKVSTSEGALITRWLPKLSVTDPTEGVQRFLPSAQNLFIQSLFFTLACFQHHDK